MIDPKREECSYPFPEICGAVVAWKLVQVLFAECGVPAKEWEELLEFAAIATVGDVMRLQDENRIIVKYGLSRMEHTSSIGLRKAGCQEQSGFIPDYGIPYRFCNRSLSECGRQTADGKACAVASAVR